MKIAYVTNRYPAVSHTFIRREIAGLEALGLPVERYSVRRVEGLTDPADLAELDRTRIILDGGFPQLSGALERVARRHPIRFAKTARLAATIGFTSERGMARHGAYLAEACVLREWLQESGATHVHAHFGTNSTAVAMLCRTLGGPPYSFTTHGPEEFDKPLLLSLPEKIKRATFVAGVSSFGRSQLYRYTDWEEWGKIHIVPCGVDASFLDSEPSPVPEAKRLVCVGRLCEQKGQVLLVHALGQLAARGVAFELVLVGDGEMRGEVEEAARHYGIEERVRITGWATGDVVRDEIRAARAFVLPSFAEGLPVAIMEALAMGRPVVSTYIAGIPELVVPEKNGWLVPAGHVDALAAALEQVLAASPERLSEMGRDGQARVRERHDSRNTARTLYDLFQRYSDG